MSAPRVSVVLPALNEARNLPHVFTRMPLDVHEVILVDGNSIDGTVAEARRLWPGVRVVSQSRTGKGNALACGFESATGDVIAMVDADGSADPAEIPRFVFALTHDGADFAKGTRFLPGGGSSDITRLRALGNRFLSSSFNLLYGSRYTDLCYGFNVFWRRHVPALALDATTLAPADGSRLWGDGFEVETLIHIRAVQAGLTVSEVASYEHSRIHGVSNLNAFSDGFRIMRILLSEHRHPTRSDVRVPLARPAAPAPAPLPPTVPAARALPPLEDDVRAGYRQHR
jgi:glycosyltransferase involved in cell wall biosynthesis